MSQLDASNLFLPIGSNWNEHSASYATTVTGAFSTAAASAGLAAWVSALNIGNSVTVAIRHEVMMIGLRPSLSLSQPQKTTGIGSGPGGENVGPYVWISGVAG